MTLDSSQVLAHCLERIEERVPGVTTRHVPYSPLLKSVGFGRVTPPAEPLFTDPVTVLTLSDVADLSSVLRIAVELGCPVSVRQATGYLTPDHLRPERPHMLVIDLSPMRDIEIDEAHGFVEIGPMVTQQKLNEVLEPLGYRYPLAVGPVSWSALVGLNTSGHLVDVNVGKPGDYVLGLEVVMPDGSMVQTGHATIRKPAGPDLTRLFIGSQGLFGVITRIRLRLVRSKPTVFATASFASARELARAIEALYREDTQYCQLLDFVDSNYMEMTGYWKDPSGVLALMEIPGDTLDAASARYQRMIETFERSGFVDSRLLTPQEWTEMLGVRNGIYDYLEANRLVLIVGEVLDAQLSRLEETITKAMEFQERILEVEPELKTFLWGHIGSLSCHPAICAPDQWSFERVQSVTRSIRSELLELKDYLGTSVGEQGIFPEHADWYKRTYGEESLNVLRKLKSALDPADRFNPGRLEV